MIITAALKDGEKCFQWIIWGEKQTKKPNCFTPKD